MAQQAIARSGWSLVIPEAMFGDLHRHLFPGDGDEHGAVIVAGVHQRPDGTVRLLARDLFLAKDGIDYVPGKRGYRMLKAEFIQRHISACNRERLAYLAIHNHGGSDSVGFSTDDIASHERGYPALLDVSDGNPVGALVFAKNAVAGDIWLPDRQRVVLDRAEIVGRRRHILYPAPPRLRTSVGNDIYDRQTRLFGDHGQEIFREATIGIVGLGGVGSIIVELLARLGVGHFVLIDPDRLDPTNIPRVLGARRRDVWWSLASPAAPQWMRRLALRFASRKVDIARRIIRQANPAARVRLIDRNVLEPKAAAALQVCDYIFLAADEMQARLLVNAIVHQFLVPGVQVGSKVTVAPERQVTDIFSVVRPMRPGINCLWCNQLINPARLADEAKSRQERDGQRYVDDPDVVAPSVVTLNAVGASHACNDFLMYMTGLADKDGSLDFAHYDSRARKVLLATPRHDSNCPECGTTPDGRLAHGDTGRRLPIFSR